MHPSVTAESFSCSISAGLTEYSAVRCFQGLTANCQGHSEKVDNPLLKLRRLPLSLFHCEKLQTLAFTEEFLTTKTCWAGLFICSTFTLCEVIFCKNVLCVSCLNWDVWPPVVFLVWRNYPTAENNLCSQAKSYLESSNSHEEKKKKKNPRVKLTFG